MTPTTDPPTPSPDKCGGNIADVAEDVVQPDQPQPLNAPAGDHVRQKLAIQKDQRLTVALPKGHRGWGLSRLVMLSHKAVE